MRRGCHIFTLKQVFTLFTERTRDFFFDQGVTLRLGEYIATGRSFDALTSNFVHLYHLYARSHLYWAAEMVAFSVLYGAFTSKTWAGYFAVTWPVVRLLLADARWLFNPKSFEGLGVRTHFYEFLEWLDSEDGEVAAGEVPPWPACTTQSSRGRAKLGFGSKLVRTLFGQVPKIALYCGASPRSASRRSTTGCCASPGWRCAR